MVQTIRNQIKAYKIQIEKNSRSTIKVDSPLLAWSPRHAPWQYTPFHKRQDSATTAYEKIRHMSYQNKVSWSTNWNQHGSKVFGSDVTEKQMSIDRNTEWHDFVAVHGKCRVE